VAKTLFDSLFPLGVLMLMLHMRVDHPWVPTTDADALTTEAPVL